MTGLESKELIVFDYLSFSRQKEESKYKETENR